LRSCAGGHQLRPSSRALSSVRECGVCVWPHPYTLPSPRCPLHLLPLPRPHEHHRTTFCFAGTSLSSRVLSPALPLPASTRRRNGPSITGLASTHTQLALPARILSVGITQGASTRLCFGRHLSARPYFHHCATHILPPSVVYTLFGETLSLLRLRHAAALSKRGSFNCKTADTWSCYSLTLIHPPPAIRTGETCACCGGIYHAVSGPNANPQQRRLHA
jgi:hypothetical protein